MEREEWRKTMKRNSLIGVDRVRFNDFSQYDSEKCNNGGCYGFWTNYDRLDNGTWKVSYGTTADFDYCPVCGFSMIITKEKIAVMNQDIVVENMIL